jgi:hypothetical protein
MNLFGIPISRWRLRADHRYGLVILLCLFAWGLLISMVVTQVRGDSGIPSTSITAISTTTSLPRKPPRVLLVGDSTMAGLRWFRDGQIGLTGGTYVVDVESCRPVVGKSCYGRERRIPASALSVLRKQENTFDAVVLMAGTHGDPETRVSGFRIFQRETLKMGTKLIVLTVRDFGPRARLALRKDPTQFARLNKELWRLAEKPKTGNTYIADWASFSKGHLGWFLRDGVHLTFVGVLALQWFISQNVSHALGSPCTSIRTEPCPIPTRLDAFRDWLKFFNVQFTDEHCYQDGGKRIVTCERDRRMP